MELWYFHTLGAGVYWGGGGERGGEHRSLTLNSRGNEGEREGASIVVFLNEYQHIIWVKLYYFFVIL